METKNSFIRKAIALAMCGVMVFSLTSCTGDRGSSEDSSISNPITEPTSGDPGRAGADRSGQHQRQPLLSTMMLWAG